MWEINYTGPEGRKVSADGTFFYTGKEGGRERGREGGGLVLLFSSADKPGFPPPWFADGGYATQCDFLALKFHTGS